MKVSHCDDFLNQKELVSYRAQVEMTLVLKKGSGAKIDRMLPLHPEIHWDSIVYFQIR